MWLQARGFIAAATPRKINISNVTLTARRNGREARIPCHNRPNHRRAPHICDVRAVRGELLANEKWPTSVFIPVFFVSTFSVLFYFNFLYYMQLELRDSFLTGSQKCLQLPFLKCFAHRFSGINCSDIRLRSAFLTPLIGDFKTLTMALEKDGSKSDRAMLLGHAAAQLIWPCYRLAWSC